MAESIDNAVMPIKDRNRHRRLVRDSYEEPEISPSHASNPNHEDSLNRYNYQRSSRIGVNAPTNKSKIIKSVRNLNQDQIEVSKNIDLQ